MVKKVFAKNLYKLYYIKLVERASFVYHNERPLKNSKAGTIRMLTNLGVLTPEYNLKEAMEIPDY